MNELVEICHRQNEAYRRANPDAGGSQVVVSAKAVTQKSRGQASSPRVDANPAKSVNSGKNKQMQVYDPVQAGKQAAAQGGQGQSRYQGGGGSQGGKKGNSGAQGHPPRHPGPSQNQLGQGQQMAAQAHGGGQAGNRYENAVQVQGGGQAGNRYDDGNSAMARAGYQVNNLGMAHRLGARMLDPDDQRLRLDKIYQSEEIEEPDQIHIDINIL